MDARADAYGQMLLAGLRGAHVAEIVERDDGFIDVGMLGTALYLAPFRRWPAHHRQAMRYVRGRVLDIGCGGGRVALHVQERGQEAVAVAVSPGAVEACRLRGVRDVRLLGIDDVDQSVGPSTRSSCSEITSASSRTRGRPNAFSAAFTG